MAYAYLKVSYAGTNVFNLPFSYLNASDIYLYVNGTERPQSEITFTSASVVTITTAGLVTGDSILIARVTALNGMLVVYSNDTQLTKTNLNKANTQLLYNNQETRDYIDLVTITTLDEANTAASAASASAVSASDSADDAAADALIASNASTAAQGYATSAENSKDAAYDSELAAAASEDNADISEGNAEVYKNQAVASASTASTKATEAAASAAAALVSEGNAAASETAAGISETNAGVSEDNAAQSAIDAAASAASVDLSGIFTYIKTVDGTGSGLDADLLDGNHATAFATASHVTDTAAPHGATSTNTVSRIVTRDSSGNFSAGTITAALTGTASNAAQATKLTTARTINVSGGVTGTATSFNGTANITIPTTITAADALTAIKTVDGTGSGLDADLLDGYHITDITTYVAGAFAPVAHVSDTAAHGAVSTNTASKIVTRDASGNFAAGTISANLTGTATSSTYALQLLNSRTFNVSGDVTGTAQSFSGTGNVVIPTTLAKKRAGTHAFRRLGNAGGTDNVTISAANGSVTPSFSVLSYAIGSGSAAALFTAPVTGLYHFDVCLRFLTTTNAAIGLACGLQTPTNLFYDTCPIPDGTLTGDLFTCNVSVDEYLTAGGTVSISALKLGAGSCVVDVGASWWSGHLIYEA